MNGQPHGKGKKTLPDGTSYDGQWENGGAKGNGIKVLPSGAVFEGLWANSEFVKGKSQFPDG